MKIEQIKGRLLLKKPKIIDPLNETETIKDVMLVDGKIEKIGIIDAENDVNNNLIFNFPEDILVISSQSFWNALPNIPALSKAETATQVNFFFFALKIFGAKIAEAPTPAIVTFFSDSSKNFLLFIIIWRYGKHRKKAIFLNNEKKNTNQ